MHRLLAAMLAASVIIGSYVDDCAASDTRRSLTQVTPVGLKVPAAGNATSRPIVPPRASGVVNGVAGLSAAVAAGIAINVRQIQALPALATTPMAAANGTKALPAKFPTFPIRPSLNSTGLTITISVNITITIESASVPAVLPIVPFQPVTQAIWASGTQFWQGPGQPFAFVGANNFNLVDASAYSEASVYNLLVTHWNNGIRVVRMFAFNNGQNGISSMPIQDPVGVFHEAALQRYDYVLAAAGLIGIRLILCVQNHWDVYNGNQWYVDQTMGPGNVIENFYTNPATKDAYKTWVSTIVGRTNTVNGRQYKNDPTIFAWEICNECHTSDDYEINLGMQAGTLLYEWEVEMAAYWKSLGITQMLSQGSEGYRARGPHDPSAPIGYPFNNWINSGTKGEDFVRNLGIPQFDFYCIHVYPDAWGADASTDSWFYENYIGNRARLAHGVAGKPIIMEECGTQTFYGNRDNYVQQYFDAANRNGYAGTFVWAQWPLVPETSFLQVNGYTGYAGYNFGVNQMGSHAVANQTAYINGRTAGCAACSDAPPQPAVYTCAQQAAWGQCSQPWMAGHCQISCGKCAQCKPAPACLDVTPPCSSPPCPSCAQQMAWGQCYKGWMLLGTGSGSLGYCVATCGRCLSS